MNTIEKVRNFIQADVIVGGDQQEAIADDLPLLELGIIDSLAIYVLIEFIEAEFGILVGDEELVGDNFATVGDIARLIDSKCSSDSVA